MAREVDVGKEQRLKAQIAASRRKRTLPNAIWQSAKETDLFPRAIEGDEAAVAALSDKVGYEFYRQRTKRRRKPSASSRNAVVQISLPEKEAARERVTARYYARLARRYGQGPVSSDGRPPTVPAVASFRDRFLLGPPVSIAQADRILESPAAAFLPAGFFEHGRVPLLDHRSTVVSQSAALDPKLGFVEEVALTVAWSNNDGEQTWTGTLKIPKTSDCPLLPVIHKGQISKLAVVPGSVFDLLRVLSDRLSTRYGWEQAEAVHFILTDTDPSTPGIRASETLEWSDDHAHGVLTMRIQPWVSVATVATVYRQLQLRMLQSFDRSSHPRQQVHPTLPSSLELFDFISEGRDKGQSWRELVSRWNATHPKSQRYPGEIGVRNFQRDYRLIKARVVWLLRPRPSAAPEEHVPE